MSSNKSRPNSTAVPPSPGHRLHQDRMRESIKKESSAGWTTAVTPLRIAKRDTGSPSINPPNPTLQPEKVVARRSSNSYKHMFTNNLVSKSPFKSSSATPSRGPRLPSTVASGSSGANIAARPVRKVSGEKRIRPDSLVQQAEVENAERARQLGFKRRQSQAFQGLVQKTPVTKSPFRRIVGADNAEDDDELISSALPSHSSPNGYTEKELGLKTPSRGISSHKDLTASQGPISISFPTYSSRNDGDTASYDGTDSYIEEDLHRGIKSDEPPPLPPKHAPPPARTESPLCGHRRTPSPGGNDRSPMPSIAQASPARSSMANRSRLLGPRSRSVSGSPADTPGRRERRKTVTFDERCDVLEFDRESHEDVVFDTDDEAIYGPPDHNSKVNCVRLPQSTKLLNHPSLY